MAVSRFQLLSALFALLPVYMLITYLKRGFEMDVFGEEFRADSKELHFILVLCGGSNSNGMLSLDVGRQIRQTDILLKSAALFTTRTLHFHVIADNKQLYGRLVNRTANWPESYKRKTIFSMHEVWYPEDRKDMRTLFKVCATELLFVPEIFPDMDRAIYLDTDVIFMRPPEDLWAFFDSFSPSHVAAMAPCLHRYGPYMDFKIPYYGETGINSGVMLIDLDRVRKLDNGWTGASLEITDKYRTRIKLGDQDILNILFSSYPEQLYELPCEWNFRAEICSESPEQSRLKVKRKNKCFSAEENGVSLLHGNAMAFVKGNEVKIQAIFEGFEKHRLGDDSLNELHTNLRTALSQLDGRDLRKSECSSVPDMDNILLGELEKQAGKSR